MPTQQDSNRQEYLDERRLLLEAELAMSQTLDKALLTLSSGALGLSITLARYFVPEQEPQLSKALLWAWSLFGGAVVCTIISLFTSQTALRRHRDILDTEYSNSDSSDSTMRNYWALCTSLCNLVALVLFILGVIILAYLAWLGLPSGQ